MTDKIVVNATENQVTGLSTDVQTLFYVAYPIGGNRIVCDYKGRPLMGTNKRSAIGFGVQYFGPKKYEIKERWI